MWLRWSYPLVNQLVGTRTKPYGDYLPPIGNPKQFIGSVSTLQWNSSAHFPISSIPTNAFGTFRETGTRPRPLLKAENHCIIGILEDGTSTAFSPLWNPSRPLLKAVMNCPAQSISDGENKRGQGIFLPEASSCSKFPPTPNINHNGKVSGFQTAPNPFPPPSTKSFLTAKLHPGTPSSPYHNLSLGQALEWSPACPSRHSILPPFLRPPKWSKISFLIKTIWQSLIVQGKSYFSFSARTLAITLYNEDIKKMGRKSPTLVVLLHSSS